MKKSDFKNGFRFFTIFQWKEEQIYLKEQHKEGWKFTHVYFPGFYRFEKCEPEDMVYQLDYHAETASHKPEYVQMFQDCGWEYLGDFFGYSYFRKPTAQMQDNEEEIFCDDASRLDMIRRVFKGRMIPLLFVFFLLLLPQLFLQLLSDHPLNRSMTVAFGVLLVLYLVIFLNFGRMFYQYWKRTNK